MDSIHDYQLRISHDPDNKYNYLASLCTKCDINGDSIPDIIYGQPGSGVCNDYPGRVNIHWGGENISTNPDLVFYSPRAGDYGCHFGESIVCLGDVSGDGIDDIWVVQAYNNFLYHGGRPFDTIPDMITRYPYINSYVEAIGDINNDGYNDILVTYETRLISYISYIFCYPRMDSVFDAVFTDGNYFSVMNQGLVSNLGYDKSWCGDIDGDGIDDAIITGGEFGTAGYSQGWAIIQSGWDAPVSVSGGDNPSLSDKLEVEQNYPNPFNSGTTIEFTLPRSEYTEVKIYNLLGEVVAIPIQQRLPAGVHQITWNGLDAQGQPVASGMYFYQIISGNKSEAKKMILLK